MFWTPAVIVRLSVFYPPANSLPYTLVVFTTEQFVPSGCRYIHYITTVLITVNVLLHLYSVLAISSAYVNMTLSTPYRHVTLGEYAI